MKKHLLVAMLLTPFAIIFAWLGLLFSVELSGIRFGTKEERKFINAAKENLENIGDSIKIVDIHSGDWVKVCTTPPNDGQWRLSFFPLESSSAIEKAGHHIWIPFEEMYLSEINTPNSVSCLSRENARLEAVGDFENRKDVHPEAKVTDDFIELKFTHIVR